MNKSNPYDETMKQVQKSRPQVAGEQSAFGHAPNPEVVTSKTTLERAQEMGLYTEASESKPHEIDLAEEIEEQQASRNNNRE
jgi:hypothetical protein